MSNAWVWCMFRCIADLYCLCIWTLYAYEYINSLYGLHPDKTGLRFWAEFRPFSNDFLPKRVLAIYISAVLVRNLGRKTQVWYPICRFSAHMFMDSTYFLPMFCSFLCLVSAYLCLVSTFCSFCAGPVLQGCGRHICMRTWQQFSAAV